MKYLSLRLPLAGLFALLLFSACEDPSNVGIGLVGEQGGEPVVVELAPGSFARASLEDFTANPDLFLAGTVADPLMGTFKVDSYVEFGTPSRSNAFTAGTLTEATLRLRRSYVYGDTTSTVTLALRSMPAEWSFQTVPTDTSLAAGDVVTEFSFTASDTLVEVPLPAAWLAANEAVFRSDTFAEDFHGFKIEAVSGDAVVGFSSDSSYVRAVSADNEAFFGLTRQFPSMERITDPDLPADRVALQDGVGPGAAITFDLTGEALRQNSLNRFTITLPVDTLLLAEDAGSFVRPRVDMLRLVAKTDDGRTLLFGDVEYEDGAFVFDSGDILRRLNYDLIATLQPVLLGRFAIDHFELRLPPSFNTVDALILYGAGAPAGQPRATVTVTPLDA